MRWISQRYICWDFPWEGVVAQLAALERPSLVRKLMLVGTAAMAGDDIMRLDKPELKKISRTRASRDTRCW
jgi:pimeloyl-ACP methyl ester carboxylesterase